MSITFHILVLAYMSRRNGHMLTCHRVESWLSPRLERASGETKALFLLKPGSKVVSFSSIGPDYSHRCVIQCYRL